MEEQKKLQEAYESAIAEHQRIARRVEEAQRGMQQAVERLESLEDQEAIRAFDADTEMLERGEAELLPWEESKRRRRELR